MKRSAAPSSILYLVDGRRSYNDWWLVKARNKKEAINILWAEMREIMDKDELPYKKDMTAESVESLFKQAGASERCAPIW